MHIRSLTTAVIEDLVGKKHPTSTNSIHIKSALAWLEKAQDVTNDGGVSAWYSLLNGWRPSYIETTGYIINTFLACAELFDDSGLIHRAEAMAGFLVSMQLKNGAYRSHTPIQKKISPPTVFDTGQDLIGMAEIYGVTKNKTYLTSMVRAADWLCGIQEKDGSWLKHTFGNKKHTYHTRVAWGLLEVFRVTKNKKYRLAAINALEWSAQNQLSNGWFSHNELQLPSGDVPFTHTISYAAEGFLWSGIVLKKQRYINIADRAVRPLAQYFLKHSFLPASFGSEWRSADRYSCLTGNAQLSLVWGTLYQQTGDTLFYKAMKRMNHNLKQLQNRKSSDAGVRGAIKGSQPIYGDLMRNQGYCRMAYLNWATKFFIDALLKEKEIGAKKK
jgi:uncharacterized protein YyaL (SSP411 family)